MVQQAKTARATEPAELRGVRRLPESLSSAGRLTRREPAVHRAKAANWPAVQRWTMTHLATLGTDLPVRLVLGTRECATTRFVDTTFGEYLATIDAPAGNDEPRRYLKEFDLLARFPQLRADLRQQELFPARTIRSSSAWIGPAGARTGLHHDLLDNIAVQVIGRKRFFLARPGTVERAGGLSAKYDKWARLSSIRAAELAELGDADQDLFVVDLNPGDVLQIPAGWWHEVVNLSSGVLLSGFFGPSRHVLGIWAQETSRQVAHRLGLVGRDHCTCHEPSPTVGPRPPAVAR